MRDSVEVRVRDCECPGTPHADEGDVVFVATKLGLEGGIATELDIEAIQTAGITNEEEFSAALRKRWFLTFVRYGAIGWNWLDEQGKPVPFDAQVLIDDYSLGMPVVEKANELYMEVVLAPFLKRLGALSRIGPTAASTSPRARSTHSRNGRSSRATTAASRR
jgi:hypothetical protein